MYVFLIFMRNKSHSNYILAVPRGLTRFNLKIFNIIFFIKLKNVHKYYVALTTIDYPTKNIFCFTQTIGSI